MFLCSLKPWTLCFPWQTLSFSKGLITNKGIVFDQYYMFKITRSGKITSWFHGIQAITTGIFSGLVVVVNNGCLQAYTAPFCHLWLFNLLCLQIIWIPSSCKRQESQKHPFGGTAVSLEVIIASEKAHLSLLFCLCLAIRNAKNIEILQEIL